MALSLTVLGSSSATPTASRYPSSFLLRSNKQKDYFLIDCGEGTQILLRRVGIRMQQISRIFISHLHGDHFFGLIGFLFTQSLLGRKEELHIYAHKPLQKIIRMQLKMDKSKMTYPIFFHPINARKKKEMPLYENDKISVTTFPLLHSIPTNGFLFREKGHSRLVSKEFIAQYRPTVKQILGIKEGNDFRTQNGVLLSNKSITELSSDLKTFAYCSDTAYTETILPFIHGVNLLYHEATFMQDMLSVAEEKYHSTAMQAATIAKLAQVDKLLIGHYSARYKDISPLLQEAQDVFPNTLAAFEGATFQI
ncbi:MAG: ribonuclease Z [Bacteroidales bacterium]|jgi:ribonuclease Z|nr:ribonuclease Z [Bacteroidales bacterium]